MAPNLGFLRKCTKLSIPAHFRCPISLDLMKDPVTLSTGITYDRHSIETWLDTTTNNRTCPVTKQAVTEFEPTPNHTIRKMIQDWCVANRCHGIERIPTPRAPVTPTQASEILGEVESACARHDRARLLDSVAKLRNVAKESERNRRCISSNGSGRELATSFQKFAGDEKVCLEIMSALTCMFPLGDEACWEFASSPESLRSIVSILRSGNLAGKLDAVLVLKEIVADKERAAVSAETEGLVEAIAKLIKEPISPRTTKTSLVAAYYLVSSSGQVASRFVDPLLLSKLVEILVDSEKSICEKALGVLDGILCDEKAREEIYDNALAMPVLVKKMFRVSDMATGFAVSAVWKLLKGCSGERRTDLARAALSVGAFQKLLLLLQVGCGETTKEKASELLRMLNGDRRNVECIDSMDFGGIKRSF